MSDSILYVAKAKSADGSRDVHQKHHHERFSQTETHHGRRVHRSQRDDSCHSALVEKAADDEIAKVGKLHEYLGRLTLVYVLRHGGLKLSDSVHLRHGALLKPHEYRKAHHEKDGSGDDVGCRHQRIHSEPLRLPRSDHRKTKSKRNQASDVAERPSPARDLAHGLGAGYFGQEGRIERFAHVVTDVAHDKHRH